ncbi:MAG: YqgE/AlgH family protein [Gammaproteobacteria bacterium]|nr:YqgE/AlgH family protein [Gammaproteobacteria bacterium]
MDTPSYLTNHFLIAMPGLADPNFYHTVTYICEHNANGALGIVINRQMNIRLGELLSHMNLEAGSNEIANQPVYLGGPVQPEHGFVLHHPVGEWDATLKVSDTLGVTTSRDILSAIAHGTGPQKTLVALGYAGWGAGQLEHEMAANAWLSGPADEHVLFETPDERRWEAAASLLGVDLNRLSDEAGHA